MWHRGGRRLIECCLPIQIAVSNSSGDGKCEQIRARPVCFKADGFKQTGSNMRGKTRTKTTPTPSRPIDFAYHFSVRHLQTQTVNSSYAFPVQFFKTIFENGGLVGVARGSKVEWSGIKLKYGIAFHFSIHAMN